ncbi:MAG: response regulator, partial [Pyrinomonadaceae bacterium]
MSKIIVIEDNELIARIYETKLLKEGHVVSIAFDGESGFEMIKADKPDLVLVDLMLPNMSGIEVIKQLRAEKEFAELPVIAFSADETLLQEAQALNATEAISKKEVSSIGVLKHIRALLESVNTSEEGEPNKLTAKRDVSSSNTPLPVETGKRLERVLVVDDDEIIAAIIIDVIEELGYAVVKASDGREAYQIMTKDADFVAGVFDVEMPHIKGTDLVKHMRTEKRLAAIPVMIVTSEQSLKVQLDSFAGGASIFLPKPFTRTVLKTMFEMMVQTRHKK